MYCFCQRDFTDAETSGYSWIGCENLDCTQHQWYHVECLEARNVNVKPFLRDEYEDSKEVSDEELGDSELLARDETVKDVHDVQPQKRRKKKFFCSKECAHNVRDKKLIDSKTLIFTGFLQEGLRDAVRQNDGDRKLIHTKYHLARVFNGRHPIYRRKLTRMLANIEGFESSHVAFDLKYNSTVNLAGQIGKNIEMDLYNEFCNNVLKEYLHALHGNIEGETVGKKCKSIGVFKKVAEAVKTGICNDEIILKSRKDVNKLVDIVLKNRMLENSGKRYHKRFKDFNNDFLFVGNIENLKNDIKALCKGMDARRECNDLS